MRPRSQYRRNQTPVPGSYEETEQESGSSGDEEYQPDKKKTDPKATTGEARMNQEAEADMNPLEYSILLDPKLATVSHARLKSSARERASVLSSNKRRFQRFNRSYFPIQPETGEPSRKEKERASDRPTATGPGLGTDRDQKPEVQPIDLTDESNREANRASYNKTSYVRDAMTILIINKVFPDSPEFRKIDSKNVTATSSLYYLMSDSKKRENNKAADMILNPTKDSFIERNARYFQAWLDRFRHGPSQSEGDRDLVPKIYTSKISKSKAASPAPKQSGKGNLDRVKKPNPPMERSRNGDLVYKVPIAHTIEHPTQDQREQPHRVEKLERKFDDLSRKMEDYLRKSTELLNDRNTTANRDRVHTRNRDRTRDQDHSRDRDRSRERRSARNRHKVTKHHSSSSSGSSSRSRRRRSRDGKHRREQKSYYRSSSDSESEGDTRIVPRERRRMLTVNRELSPVHTRPSRTNRDQNRERRRSRNRRNSRERRSSRDRYRVSKYRDTSTSSSRSSKDRRRSRSRPRSKNRVPRLRTTEIMDFDPAETSVAFFIRRFKHIAEIEGKEAVLRILLMCLKKSAME